MKITEKSHIDHGLSPRLMALIARRYADRQAFFIDTFVTPDDEPAVPSQLHADVPESECFYQQRCGRKTWSRMCRRPPTTSSLVTVIGGPSSEAPGECILYTAYGGPLAPREPGDPGIETPEQAAESFAFWRTHALSSLGSDAA